MNRISEDVGKVRMYVGPAFMYSINTVALFIIVISYMISIAPALTLYTILPLPILSVTIYKLSRIINEKSLARGHVVPGGHTAGYVGICLIREIGG